MNALHSSSWEASWSRASSSQWATNRRRKLQCHPLHTISPHDCCSRSQLKYKLSAIMLACLMVYLIFCAVMVAVQAAGSGGIAYTTMVFSVIVTYGSKRITISTRQICSRNAHYLVYVLSSLFALDPWHIFTSFIPYLLLSPTYINILNMSAPIFPSSMYQTLI